MNDKNGMQMAWNEPGKSGNEDKNKDPWGKRNDGPPDLDKIIRDLIKKMRKFFETSDSNSNNNTSGDGSGNSNNDGNKSTNTNKGLDFKSFDLKGFKFGFSTVLIVIAVLYIVSGFYIIKPAEQAVITRLGKYQRTVGQGPHWLLPILESKVVVNTERVEYSSHSGAMLTKDENIVNVAMEVQYRINDVEHYVFNVFEPQKSLLQAADSALRQVIGSTTLEDVLTKGKAKIAISIEEQLKSILDMYDIGLLVVAVTFKEAKPPAPVKEAFDAVIQAREERERLRHEAEAYANKILPEASGRAERMRVEASAYQESTILEAVGDTKRFSAVLTEYKLAPEVTKKRLYLDAMESVLSNSSKILVDVNSGNNLIYLPIDKIMDLKNSKNNELAQENDAKDSGDLTSSSSKTSGADVADEKTDASIMEKYRRIRGQKG